METYSRGWKKYHKGCGGLVIFIENIESHSPEWFMECIDCGKQLVEEEVEFQKIG